MPVARTRTLALALVAAGLVATGCGDEEGPERSSTAVAPAAQGADLTAVKAYLTDHTTRLRAAVADLRTHAERYHALAASARFDHAALLRTERAETVAAVKGLQRGFAAANPAYEEMEGIVAGVPELADFDVVIDAGGDASDPENAVPFSIRTDDGRTFEQPGNLNYLVETAAWGTDRRFVARGVRPDLDGDGRVEFGEALPDARFMRAVTREFDETAGELDVAARAWQPTLQDALTALVVMTPTMSEYFEAWKSSRFIAGDQADEKAFVAASRLQDIEDILGGLVLIYDNVRPAVRKADAQQAAQTGTELRELRDFAGRLRREEAQGKRFTAQDADVLGTQAQDRAEAIAGQVSQAAAALNVELVS